MSCAQAPPAKGRDGLWGQEWDFDCMAVNTIKAHVRGYHREAEKVCVNGDGRLRE